MKALDTSICVYCGSPAAQGPYCCRGCETLDQQIFKPETQSSEWAYLDQPNFKAKYQRTGEGFDYELYVEGLHCASCLHLIERLPEYDSSIREARVNFGKSRLGLQVTKDFSLARTSELLHSWGYRPHFLAASENTEALHAQENRTHLKKLAVAAACVGNIMLFVVPVYSGLEGPWKNVFNWMSFVLFLPILLYSATGFYQGAWNSLRYRVINVDLSISIALISGFVFSTYNLLRGHGEIYLIQRLAFYF